ncbi:unnamed protein product [Caenorhabditis angaria]|uniref:Uncharacterized protein n=1 Tax=Caenorhabditis angaria TaxID=860376 RepID=A0A9P1IH54_9PELO|nr:unnamed protein product [Caenorhabditis angaria]
MPTTYCFCIPLRVLLVLLTFCTILATVLIFIFFKVYYVSAYFILPLLVLIWILISVFSKSSKKLEISKYLTISTIALSAIILWSLSIIQTSIITIKEVACNKTVNVEINNFEMKVYNFLSSPQTDWGAIAYGITFQAVSLIYITLLSMIFLLLNKYLEELAETPIIHQNNGKSRVS